MVSIELYVETTTQVCYTSQTKQMFPLQAGLIDLEYQGKNGNVSLLLFVDSGLVTPLFCMMHVNGLRTVL